MNKNYIKCLVIPWGFIAACMSYTVNKSILWLILHVICGGWYVLYWLFSYTRFAEWVGQFVVY